MKFGQKIFIFTLICNMIALNIVAYLIISNNHSTNVKRESSRRVSEHSIVANLIYSEIVLEKINSGVMELDSGNIVDAMSIVSNDYINNNLNDGSNMYLQLYDQDSCIFSTLATETDYIIAKLQPQDDGFTTMIEDVGDKAMLFVASIIRLNDNPYTIVSVYDINPIFELRKEQTDFFIRVNLIISCTMATILWVVIHLLMLRMRKMTKAARQVAQGDYSISMDIGGSDEISQLSHDFNKMISAVNMNIRELKDLADSRKKFIDNLTHEMKTPLTSIIGFADILRSARTVDEDARVEYANAIYDEAIHFKNLSDRLMEMILLERSQPDLERVEMDKFLHEISSQIIPLLERRNIQLNIVSESCIMLIDKELIKSMVVNLVDNASKSYKDGGVIELTLRRSGDDKMTLSVRDYGCGIPKDELYKVIEPFYMLDKARTRKSGGAGLGLALCKEIASVHKARLTIDSGVGQGTCVTVAFEEDAL